MAKATYHVNPATGNPGICGAMYACPFGGSEAHFSSRAEAGKAFEYAMSLAGSSFASSKVGKKPQTGIKLEEAARSLDHGSRHDLVTDGARVFRMDYNGEAGDGVNVTEVSPSGIIHGSIYLDEAAKANFKLVSADEANAIMAPKVGANFDLNDPHAFFSDRAPVDAEAAPGDIYVKNGVPHVVLRVARNKDSFGVELYDVARIDEFGVRRHDVTSTTMEPGSAMYARLTSEEADTFIEKFNEKSSHGWASEAGLDYPRFEEVERASNEYDLARNAKVTRENGKSILKAIANHEHMLGARRLNVVGNSKASRLEAAQFELEEIKAAEHALDVKDTLRRLAPRRERREYPPQPKSREYLQQRRSALVTAVAAITKEP